VKLSELKISHVRNVQDAHLKDLADVNIIFGENGAGKTSILESVYILGLARSFRSPGLSPVIQRDSEACTVFGRIVRPEQVELPIGVHRPRGGGFKIRLGGEAVSSVVRLAEVLPLQLINAASYLLLDGGPKQRRQFLDWGVFHVEHSFYDQWRRAQKALKQRNSILRAQGTAQQLAPWDRELIDASAAIHTARSSYVTDFIPVFKEMLGELLDLDGIELAYRPGWDSTCSYADVLNRNLTRDKARGLTQSGPHRADLTVSIHGADAGQILSRGQQKLVVSALRVAQTRLLRQQTGRRCILLVDDLPAEMDVEHQRRLCALLGGLDMQLFLTCISPDELSRVDWSESKQKKMFHVKQGCVSEVI